MNNCFILLAAGKGKRFNSKEKKQFINYKNKPLFMHSIEKAKKSKLFKKVLLVTNKQLKIPGVSVIKGGKERADSSFKALKYLKNKNIKNVFIHDAARPDFSIKLLKKIKKNLNNNKAVVPYINTNNSIKYAYKNKIINLIRERVFLTQTPQCFDFKTLYNCICIRCIIGWISRSNDRCNSICRSWDGRTNFNFSFCCHCHRRNWINQRCFDRINFGRCNRYYRTYIFT